jgi:hypothetical protein
MENAIKDYRTGAPIMPAYNFGSPTFNEDFRKKLKFARMKTENVVLIQYFAVATNNRCFAPPPTLPERDTKIINFLGQYFEVEPGALPYLCSVTANDIAKSSENDLQKIIEARPPLPTPPTKGPCLEPDANNVLGQDIITPGEMWYTPSDPTNPPRYQLDPDLPLPEDYCRDLDLPLEPVPAFATDRLGPVNFTNLTSSLQHGPRALAASCSHPVSP